MATCYRKVLHIFSATVSVLQVSMATLTYVDGGLDYLQMYSYINYDKKAMLIASDMTGDERLSLNSVCIA